MRKLHIQGRVWHWRVGQGGVVIQLPGSIKKITVMAADIKGITPDSVDRGRWKKTSDGMIRPGEVKSYIEKNLSDLVARMDARKKK